MKDISAYCTFCGMVVKGKTTAISVLASGNYLYVGECAICCYEIKRIVPKSKNTPYPESWYRHYPKGMDRG
jgi:hypothetical protein